MMRQRSRDARNSQPGLPEASDKRHAKRRVTRKSTVVIALCTTLLIAFVALARFQWGSSGQYLPFATGIDRFRAPDGTSHQNIENNPSILHAQYHRNRAPTTISQKWRVTSGPRRPDGVLKRVYLINGAFPGPTLEARSGDRLIVEVENALPDEGVSIHFHGLSMRAANDMDGAVGVTQNAIGPGDTYTYDVRIDDDQHGTFWYHSHDAVQRADGLYGGMIVHEPNEGKSDQTVDTDEHLLMLGDWYHRPAEKALEFFMHPGSFGNEPVPDSMLMNGAGAYNCPDAVPARPVDCHMRTLHDIPGLRLDRSKSNLIRVANVGAYAGINIHAPYATLKPVAVDGGNRICGNLTRRVDGLHPGERVDILIEPDRTRTVEDSVLEISLDTAPFKYPNSALTPTHSLPITWFGKPRRLGPTATRPMERFDLRKAKSATQPTPPLPEKASQFILLYAMTQKLAHLDNVPLGFINHTSWRPQASPAAALNALPRDQWDENQFVPHIPHEAESPRWVDVILNNLDEEGHPFHLHGYDFYVLSTYSSGFNWGSYSPFEDDERPGGEYELARPVRKDTVYVPRRGYAVLRLRADNPGIWMFHCHVLWHQASGMAMAFEVG